MKIEVKEEVIRDGKVYVKGDIIDIPEANVKVWIARGWGQKIEKKEEKAVKLTKELKVKKDKK